MSGLGYLFAAYTIVWLALLIYLFWLSGSIASLRKDVDALRDILSDQEPPSDDASPARKHPGAFDL